MGNSYTMLLTNTLTTVSLQGYSLEDPTPPPPSVQETMEYETIHHRLSD